MTFEEVKTLIYNWLRESSELQPNFIIQSFQSAPKPSSDFIMYDPCVTYTEKGMFEKSFTENGLVQTSQDVEITVQIDSFGKNALTIMRKVLKSLNKDSVIDDFLQNGVAIKTDGIIQNLTSLQGIEYIDRRQLDVTVNYTETFTEDLGYFDSIEFDIEIEKNENLETYSPINLSIEKTLQELYNSNIINTSILKPEPLNLNDLSILTIKTNLNNPDLTSTSNDSNTILVPVSNIQVNNRTISSFNVSWVNPLNTSEFLIELSNDDFETILETVTGLSDNYTFTNLDSNTIYQMRIYSITSDGISAYRFIETDTLLFIPNAPTMNSVSNITTTSLQANWSIVSGAINYIVEISANNFVSILETATTDNTYYNFTNLISNTSYKVRVRAVGDAESNNSNSEPALTSSGLIEKIIYSEIAVNGNYRLVKANNDNTNKVYLTSDSYSSIYPKISHDGKKLAFIKEYSTTKSDIMIYDLETNIISNLTNFATNNNYVYGAKWNSNDTKILYAYFAGDTNANPAMVKEINIATQVARTVYTDSSSQSNISPEYSLNDNEIYLTSVNSNGLIKYNIATSYVTFIASGNKYFAHQHPTQNKILYSAGGGVNYEILQREISSGTDTTVYPAYSYNVYPKYSPDANNVIWVSYETGIRQLKKKNLLTNTVTNITSDSITYHYPEWANILESFEDVLNVVLDVQVNSTSVFDNSFFENTVSLISSPSIISTSFGYAVNLDSGSKAIKVLDSSNYEFYNHSTGIFEFRKDNAGTIRLTSKDNGGEQYRFGILPDNTMFWIFASNNYPSISPSYLKFNIDSYSWVTGHNYALFWCLDLDNNTFIIKIKDKDTNIITDLSYTLQSGTQYYSSISDFSELRNGTYDVYIGNDSSSNQPVGAVHRFRLFAKPITSDQATSLL